MKWPLVSRRAYDLVLTELERQHGIVERLLEHTQRIDRVEHGLLELPYEKPEPAEPLPPELQEYVEGWQNRTVRREVIRNITLARADGKEWHEIIDDLVGGLHENV